MLTPWNRAAGYAALVTLPSWLWGALVVNVGGGFSLSGIVSEMIAGGGLLFPATAVVVLTVVRKALPALSRWRTVTIDVSVYAFLVLVCAVVSGTWGEGGLAEAVDWAFVMMTVALFDLQFVMAMGLSAWGYDRLVPTVPSGRVIRT